MNKKIILSFGFLLGSAYGVFASLHSENQPITRRVSDSSLHKSSPPSSPIRRIGSAPQLEGANTFYNEIVSMTLPPHQPPPLHPPTKPLPSIPIPVFSSTNPFSAQPQIKIEGRSLPVAEHTVERLAAVLGITKEEARHRMKQANPFSPHEKKWQPHNFDLNETDFSGKTIEKISFAPAQLASDPTAAKQPFHFENAKFSYSTLNTPNFTGAYLTSSDFSNALLTSAIFKKAELNRSNFSKMKAPKASFNGAQMEGTKWAQSELEGALFDEGNLKKAVFNGSTLTDASFTKAQLENTQFLNSSMVRANFNGATGNHVLFYPLDTRSEPNAIPVKLMGSQFQKADLPNAHFNYADLSAADLRYGKFHSSWFVGTNLTDANLERTELKNAQFYKSLDTHSQAKADLTRAQLSKSDLTGANFTNAILLESTLNDSTLVSAKFVGADLSNAQMKWVKAAGSNFTDASMHNANLLWGNFTEAHFPGADLHGATLEDAVFKKARMSHFDPTYSVTPWWQTAQDWLKSHFKYTNLSGVHAHGADFSGANLIYANLSNGNFRNTKWAGALLGGTSLQDAHFEGACFKGCDLKGVDFTKARIERADFTEAKNVEHAFFNMETLDRLTLTDPQKKAIRHMARERETQGVRSVAQTLEGLSKYFR